MKKYGYDREFGDSEIYKLDNGKIVLMARNHDNSKTYVYNWIGEEKSINELPSLKEDSSNWAQIDVFESPLKKDIQGSNEYDWDEYNKVADGLLYGIEQDI